MKETTSLWLVQRLDQFLVNGEISKLTNAIVKYLDSQLQIEMGAIVTKQIVVNKKRITNTLFRK